MWNLYEHAMIMSTLLNSAEVNNALIENKQKQSYSKKLDQQDSVISVGQILDSTANKCLIRLSTCMVNHIIFYLTNKINRNKYTQEIFTPQ